MHDPIRSVIAQSWRRVSEGGLRPDIAIDNADVEGFDTASKLMIAARPVLGDVAAALEDTAFSLVLADRSGRLVDVRCGDRAIEETLTKLGIVPGRTFTEAATGTNAISTTLEVGRGVAVRGQEHYLESLKQFACYGHPVVHPLTGRTEGVLDVTCQLQHENTLLAPFLIGAVHQIGQRLLSGARMAEQHLLAAFQSAARTHRPLPVAALSDDVFLANTAAIELLDAADHAVLRGMAVGGSRGAHTQRLHLSSGMRAHVRFERLGVGTVFVFESIDDNPIISVEPGVGGNVWVHGEAGAGHTSTVQRLLGDTNAQWLEASEVVSLGEQAWLSNLARALASAPVVVIEGVHALPETVARLAAAAFERAPARVILTSADADLQSDHQRLIARCSERIGLVPLRQRREEIPKLVLSILAQLHAPPELRFTPTALEALAANEWRGNLRELHSVVQTVTQTRATGDVTVHDLPEAYRHKARSRFISPIEQAEREVILSALRSCHGNKLEAARRLGISRTTLYRAIRRYGLVVKPDSD